MAEHTELHDRNLFIAALCLAIIGLTLLFAIAPAEDEQRFVLSGTVLERQGRSAVVSANVTVVGRNLSGNIQREVFWNGVEFIAVN